MFGLQLLSPPKALELLTYCACCKLFFFLCSVFIIQESMQNMFSPYENTSHIMPEPAHCNSPKMFLIRSTFFYYYYFTDFYLNFKHE